MRRGNARRQPPAPFADQGIVDQERHAVAGQVDVGFDGRHSQIESHLETRKSVFRLEATRATMALKVECVHGTPLPVHWKIAELIPRFYWIRRISSRAGGVAQRKTSLNHLAETQRGRNREEAVLRSGGACDSTSVTFDSPRSYLLVKFFSGFLSARWFTVHRGDGIVFARVGCGISTSTN